MSPVETLLVGAIVALSGVIGLLYRQLMAEKSESAKVIFALLEKLAFMRREVPPPTISTPEKPLIDEAKKLATEALDDDIERALKAYLSDTPPKPMKKL